MKEPVITVVVCTYNNARLLPHCLDSLVNQTLNNALYEVIIVDNNSKDRTQQIAKKYAEKHENFYLTDESNQGLSFARNKGWSSAKGKYIAFIDDDAKATPKWCQKIIESFENVIPKPVAVGGRIHPWYETDPPKWFSDELEIRSLGTSAHFLKGRRAQYGFSGSNMALPIEILNEYKGFSTNYGMVEKKLRLGEDAELFSRIYKKEPFFWYDPEIIVYHWTSISKMSLKYRIARSYKSGQTIAQIEKPEVTIKNYLRELVSFFYFLMKIPYNIMKPKKKDKKLHHIRLLEQIAFQIGSLIEQLNNINK